jgi:hypothetical protein
MAGVEDPAGLGRIAPHTRRDRPDLGGHDLRIDPLYRGDTACVLRGNGGNGAHAVDIEGGERL